MQALRKVALRYPGTEEGYQLMAGPPVAAGSRTKKSTAVR
jgi:hypothetical protein